MLMWVTFLLFNVFVVTRAQIPTGLHHTGSTQVRYPADNSLKECNCTSRGDISYADGVRPYRYCGCCGVLHDTTGVATIWKR